MAGWSRRYPDAMQPPATHGSRRLLGVLAASAVLWAAASGTETALAAGDTVTTELRPGWNLAGWTGDEADIDVLFATIPRLVAAGAWDAHDQRYRLAYHNGETAYGDLETLSPGLGLWLFLGAGRRSCGSARSSFSPASRSCGAAGIS